MAASHDPETDRPQQTPVAGGGWIARIKDSIHHFKRFGLTSGLSFVAITGSTALLREVVGLPAEAAFGISLVAIFIFNFALLRLYVFPGQVRSIHRQFVGTAIVSVCFRSAEYGAFLVLHSWLGLQYMIASVTVLILSFVAKFVVLKTFVFEHRPQPSEDEQGAAATATADR